MSRREESEGPGPINLQNLLYACLIWAAIVSIGLAATTCAQAQEPPTFAPGAVAPITSPGAVAVQPVAPAPAPADTIADFSSVTTALIQGIGGALLAVVMFFIRKVNRMFNLKLDTSERGALYEGIDNILDGAIAWGVREGGELARFETRNAIIKMAAGMVNQRLPGAVKHFKLTREDVEERVAQRLERRLPGAEPGMLPNGGLVPAPAGPPVQG